MDGATTLRWLALAADRLHEQRDVLTALDAAIGDADHGINMDRGFAAIRVRLPEWQDQEPARILRQAGSTLVSTVGGASGPLYGTAFLRAGAAVADKADLSAADLLRALEEALGGVIVRGKASPGEKTMLDAIAPAITAWRDALGQGADSALAAQAAATAAEDGAHTTIALIATKGRAAYLGPRSAGHQDPGATSAAILFRALADTLIAKSETADRP